MTSLLGRLVIDTAIAAFILETIVRHGEPAQVHPDYIRIPRSVALLDVSPFPENI